MLHRRLLLRGGLGIALGSTLLPLIGPNPGRAGAAPTPRRLRFAVPVPTPFRSDLTLDLAAHRQLLAFYRRAGSHAVLAVSSTGEMLSISWPEALTLTRAASEVFGRARTWASISCGRSVEACVRGAQQLRQAGAGLPVVVPGLLAGAAVTEAEVVQRLRLVGQRSGGSLGLYEAITPYHRTLSPGALASVAADGPYRLLKTTQAGAAAVAALVTAAPEDLAIFTANTADLEGALAAGLSGVVDFTAACFPEVLAALCSRWGAADQGTALQRLCQWIPETDSLLLTGLPFPLGVKAVLAARQLAILPLSRQAVADLTGEQQGLVRDLLQRFDALCRDLAITPLT